VPPLSQPASNLHASFDGNALPSRRLAENEPFSHIGDDRTASGYLVMVLAVDNTVARTERVSARDDEEATLRAVRLAGGRAVDVWDGLRFVEHVRSTWARSAASACTDAS
jgi:hypothetical protein